MKRTGAAAILRLGLGVLLTTRVLHAQEPGAEQPLADARPVAVALAPEEEMRIFLYRARAGARAVHFVASSGQDLDLAVADRRLTVQEATTAEHVGYTVRTIETVTVRPEQGLEFDAERTWYVHLFRAWNFDNRAAAELHVWEERPAAERIGEGSSIVPLESGSGRAVRSFFVPRWAAEVFVRAESSAGDLEMRATDGRRTFEGRRRGSGFELRFERDPIDPAEDWRLELTDPRGAAARVAVELGWAVRAPELAAAIGGDQYRLEGADGELSIELEQDEEAEFFLDVGPTTEALEVTASMEDGGFGLALARRLPPVYPDQHLHDVATGDEARKQVRLGGLAPVPAGRYWVRVDRSGGGAADLSLSWRTSARGAAEDGSDDPLLRLSSGTPQAIEFESGVSRRRFLLPESAPRGAHLQVIGSDTDADLLVRRADTGEILQASAADLADEHLALDDLVVAPGVALLLDVIRWQTGHAESAGLLHYHPTKRALPPPGYFPPFPCWEPADGWQQALAATVELTCGDGGGSGTVVSPTGLILTAAHVLDGTGGILVAFPRTREGKVRQCYVAEVVEVAAEDLDLALLRVVRDTFGRPVDGSPALMCAPIGRSTTPILGDPLRLLGFPDATLGPAGGNLTVLQGVVSALQREGDDLVWLVSDAPVSSGNSGGGVFDAQHRLLGVLVSVDTLAFARPVERVPTAWIDRIRAEGGPVR